MLELIVIVVRLQHLLHLLILPTQLLELPLQLAQLAPFVLVQLHVVVPLTLRLAPLACN